MKKYLIIPIFALIVTSCNFYSKRVNDPYDIEKAKSTAVLFYSNLSNQNYDGAVDLMADIAIEEKTRDSLTNFLKNIQLALGPFKNYNFIEGSSFVMEGRKQRYEYEVKFNAEYETETTIEKFLMIQQKGVVKILAYRVISDSLEIKFKKMDL